MIMLRVKEVATAELLTSQLPEVRVVSTIVSSSVSDTNDPGDFADFASRNEDRITTESAQMLAPSDLVQLPKGQAFALIHGGQLHKIRMPLPDASHDPLMPANLEAIGNEVRRRHDGRWHRLPRKRPRAKQTMASRNASFHEGVLAGVLFGPLKLAFALVLAFVAILLLAWTIDWVFVFKVWPEGVERLKGTGRDGCRWSALPRRRGSERSHCYAAPSGAGSGHSPFPSGSHCTSVWRA